MAFRPRLPVVLSLGAVLAACESDTTTARYDRPAESPATAESPDAAGEPVPPESQVPKATAPEGESDGTSVPATPPPRPASAARIAGATAPATAATPATPALPPGAKAAGTSDADPLFRSMAGRVAPDLATDGTWIREPVAAGRSLASLRGQVVYLQFAFVKCGACEFLTPHLRRWHQSYGPSGLVVIEVDNGLMDPIVPARAAFAAQALPYAIFHDTAGTTIAAYGVRGFPTAYLIGKDGRVIWEGNPMGSEAAVEERIQKALK